MPAGSMRCSRATWAWRSTSPRSRPTSTQLSGLDRYETVDWRIVRNDAGDHGLLVRARAKPYAPPFMMLGLNLENTTSSDFRITMTARYLAFDVLGSGSELRIDGTLGSNPGAGIELYEPLGPTPLFVAPYAGIGTATFNLIQDDAVVARYGETFLRAGRTWASISGRTATCAWGPISAGSTPTSRSAIRGFQKSRARRPWPSWPGATTGRTARWSLRGARTRTLGCPISSTVPT